MSVWSVGSMGQSDPSFRLSPLSTIEESGVALRTGTTGTQGKILESVAVVPGRVSQVLDDLVAP